MKNLIFTMCILTFAVSTAVSQKSNNYGFVECYTQGLTNSRVVLLDLKNSVVKSFKTRAENEPLSALIEAGLYTLNGLPLKSDETGTILLFDDYGKCQSSVRVGYTKREKLITFNVQKNWTLKVFIIKDSKRPAPKETKVYNYDVPGVTTSSN